MFLFLLKLRPHDRIVYVTLWRLAWWSLKILSQLYVTSKISLLRTTIYYPLLWPCIKIVLLLVEQMSVFCLFCKHVCILTTHFLVCRKFFGINDQFDPTQLMVRSNEGEKKRNIYLSSKSIRNVALHNEYKIKVEYW